MAKETILIGCRLPHGLTLTSPLNEHDKVYVRGLKDQKIIGATYVTTPVDAEFWALWKAAYLTYQPLRTGSIFEARNPSEAENKARDLENEKTGLEPLDPEAHGVKKMQGD